MSISLDEYNNFLSNIDTSDPFDLEETLPNNSTEKKSSTVFSNALAKVKTVFSKKAKRSLSIQSDNVTAMNLQNKVNAAWTSHVKTQEKNTCPTTIERYESQQMKAGLMENLNTKFNPLFIESDDDFDEATIMESKDFLSKENIHFYSHEIHHLIQQ